MRRELFCCMGECGCGVSCREQGYSTVLLQPILRSYKSKYYYDTLLYCTAPGTSAAAIRNTTTAAVSIHPSHALLCALPASFP
jgi:hypothetical protein